MTLGVHRPKHRAAVSFRASARREASALGVHTGAGIRSPCRKKESRPPGGSLSLSINPLYVVRGSSTQGELEGAKPASNKIKCRAKPCLARRAWSTPRVLASRREATIFVPQGGTKITTLFQAVEKTRHSEPVTDGTGVGIRIPRPLPLPLGEVAERSEDGEGKQRRAASRRPFFYAIMQFLQRFSTSRTPRQYPYRRRCTGWPGPSWPRAASASRAAG